MTSSAPAVMTVAILVAILGACGGTVAPPASAGQACEAAGESCSFDDQCCSHRCNVETECLGGTP